MQKFKTKNVFKKIIKKNMKEELKKLIKECEEIAGRWNGDEPGYNEDQAHIANEIIEKSNEIIDLINELNGTSE